MSEQPDEVRPFAGARLAGGGRAQSSPPEPAERPHASRPRAAPRNLPRARQAPPARRRIPGPQAIAGTVFARRPDSPVIPLIILGIGAYLAWFGVHYWRSDLKWPTDPIKSVLQGKGLPANMATPTAEEQAISGGGAAGAGAAVAKGVTAAGAGPAAAAGSSAGTTATAAGNIAIGKMLASSYGWGPGTKDWAYLETGWNAESGWDNRIWNGGSRADTHANPSGTAYGIPQALPYDKMPKAAWPPGYGGTADPTHQISWGLAYIKATYGSPSRVPGWSPNGPLPGYKGY